MLKNVYSGETMFDSEYLEEEGAVVLDLSSPWAHPGFLERGFICLKVCGIRLASFISFS